MVGLRLWVAHVLSGWHRACTSSAGAVQVSYPIADQSNLDFLSEDRVQMLSFSPDAAENHPHIGGHLVTVMDPAGRFSVSPPIPGGCGTLNSLKQSVQLHSPECTIAVNGGLFDITSGGAKPGSYACFGNLVSDGQTVQSNGGRSNVNFGIKDGRYVVGYIQPEEVEAGGFDQLIEGLGWLVRNGSTYVDQGWAEAYHGVTGHPDDYVGGRSGRVALGFNAAGELLILVVDGHGKPPAWGATMYEMAEKMVELGALEAINLDGAGSTQLWQLGVQIGYSSDRAKWGTLQEAYDPDCPMGSGSEHPGLFECARQVSSFLCIHDRQSTRSNLLQLLTTFQCWVPEIVASVVTSGMILWMLCRRQAHPEEQAKRYLLCFIFITSLSFTIVILDAYNVSIAVRATKSFSGLLIGVFQIGAVGAALPLWWCLRRNPKSWRSWGKFALMPGAVLYSIGSLLYAVMEFQLSFDDVELGSWKVVHYQALFCVAQVLCGAFHGILSQCALVLFVKLTPVPERPTEMPRLVFSAMLGIGSGPLVSAVIHAIDQCKDMVEHPVGRVGPTKLVSALGVLVMATVAFPSLAKVRDYTVQAMEEESSSDDDTEVHNVGPTKLRDEWDFKFRRRIILGALIGTSIRGFVLAGLEAGTALILEDIYGWRKSTVGLLVSCTFFACVPVKYLHARYKDRFTLTGWVRLLVVITNLATLLLFGGACEVLGGGGLLCGALILVADGVIFPCLYMSDALQRGIMTQHLLPQGSLLDSNHVSLWQVFAWGAQCMGAYVSRLSIQLGSQNFYAMVQFMVILSFVVVFDGLISPALERIAAGPGDLLETPLDDD